MSKLLNDDIILVNNFKIRLSSDILVYQKSEDEKIISNDIDIQMENSYQIHTYDNILIDPIVANLELYGRYKLMEVQRFDIENNNEYEIPIATYNVLNNLLILKSIKGHFMYNGEKISYIKNFNFSSLIPVNDEIFSNKQEILELPGLDLRPMYGLSDIIIFANYKLPLPGDIKISYYPTGKFNELNYDSITIDLSKRMYNHLKDLNIGYFPVSRPNFPQPVNTNRSVINLPIEPKIITSTNMDISSVY